MLKVAHKCPTCSPSGPSKPASTDKPMPARITSGSNNNRRRLFFGAACATPSTELARIHHLRFNKELDGAHYPVVVLCDKWEHADNTFA
jgi:hypothetical protein